MIDSKTFVSYLEMCLNDGDGYIMGACGEDPKTLKSSYYTQYSGKQRTQAEYWKEHCKRVHDCQGMIDGFLTKQLGKKIDVYARNNYANWCNPKGEGKIPDKYKVAGACVFIHSSSAGHITHVGYLYKPVDSSKPTGDWYVIEAKGVMYGVVKTKLNSGNWNRWGLPTKYISYDGSEPEKEYELGERTLKNGCMGSDVKALQSALISLGFPCGSYGADGEFGAATEEAVKLFQAKYELPVDGIFDTDDFEKLKEATKDPEDKHVIITGNSVYLWDGYPDHGGQKQEIVHKDDILELPDDEYIPVLYEGKLRFVNKKYVKG